VTKLTNGTPDAFLLTPLCSCPLSAREPGAIRGDVRRLTSASRRTVAIYEILIGLIAFAAAVVSRAEIGRAQTAIAVAGGAVSFIAGSLLWQDRPIGRRLSLIVQSLQVLQISINGTIQYGIGLGAAVTPHIGFVPDPFQRAIYSSLRFGNQVSGPYIGVNVLALIALVLLARRKHDLERM
jgi:hypothetical protein